MPAAEGADGDMFGGVTVAAPSCSQGRPVPAAEGADGDMFGGVTVAAPSRKNIQILNPFQGQKSSKSNPRAGGVVFACFCLVLIFWKLSAVIFLGFRNHIVVVVYFFRTETYVSTRV